MDLIEKINSATDLNPKEMSFLYKMFLRIKLDKLIKAEIWDEAIDVGLELNEVVELESNEKL